MPNVAQAVHNARLDGIDRLDAQLLLARVLYRPRTWLLAHDDSMLDEVQRRSLQELLRRRADGEPLAYLLGQKEFHGLMLRVTADVLVPRPETETLVDWALEHLDTEPEDARVVDLGTGSGAIAIAIGTARPNLSICATDASATALGVGRSNGEWHGVDVQWLHSDWWSALAGRRFHLALANPPYVADDDARLRALRHEPQIALRAGREGLDALRTIIVGAPRHLQLNGWILLEHGHDQGCAVRSMLENCGFEQITMRRDLSGQWRCTGGRWPLR